ncbi:MAG: SDR family oxidoreductase [Myxococcales bacterium]|nr:SDR family oxidoreductase [Myxococcales bacterium]
MSFLDLQGRHVVVSGVSNKKSIAYKTGVVLRSEGAKVTWLVHSESRRDELRAILAPDRIVVCDVEDEAQVAMLENEVNEPVSGLVHAIAFANYEGGPRPFHETRRADYLQAVQTSSFSLVEMARALAPWFEPRASVVTVSISTTRMAAENYGYMAPVKASLESNLVFLAKSFSRFSEVRFNAVAPGLLKTRSAAGIPGYADSYLYAEKVIPRGRGVAVDEVASAIAFLLSPRSSGINGQVVVIDAGMSFNYFDRDLVSRALRGD